MATDTDSDEPVHLISTWPLRCGVTAELRRALRDLGENVGRNEPGTRRYDVFVEAAAPDASTASFVPDDQQRSVTFVESYLDVDAFTAHLQGEAFTAFCRAHVGSDFYEDPAKPGWPASTTVFLGTVASVSHRDPTTP